jgi:hypothetical protein
MVLTRVVITRSPLPPGQTRPAVGHLHEGFVYEMFVTDLPVEAFSAAEIVSLYLGRALLENMFAAEDASLPTDRWVTNHGPGEDLFQVLSQWVWNHRIVLGAALLDKPLPRVTRYDVPVTPCEPTPLRSMPDGSPAEATAAPTVPARLEPAVPVARAGVTELVAFAETDPAVRAEATEPDSIASTTAHTERFGPSAFVRDLQGNVQCPAGQQMHRVEIRMRRDGPRERYEAPRAVCGACPLASRCRRTSAPTSKGRIVDLPPASTSTASCVVPADAAASCVVPADAAASCVVPADAAASCVVPADAAASCVVLAETAAPGVVPAASGVVPAAVLPLVVTAAEASTQPRVSHSSSTASTTTAQPRRLPVVQHANPYWTDLPGSEMRCVLHDTLDREHVDISAPPPPRQPVPRVLERDQRAHRRRTWTERLACNARGRNAPPVAIHIPGVPPKLAEAAGLTSPASQPSDMAQSSRRMDATT